MTHTLLIASHNAGKVQEIKAILSSLNINLISARELTKVINVDEMGTTFAQNARLKATAFLQTTGKNVIADDSGLLVDLLNGAPGIYSARYSPKENASDADRRQFLLKQLKGKPQPWKAHFHCTAIFVTTEGKYFESSGKCDGVIVPEERGNGGFGYDPIFYLPEYQATMAELSAELKNQISHRAAAISGLMPIIKTHFAQD